MKRAWLPLILALISTAGPATAKDADDRRQPVETARRYVDAFLAGDMQTLLDHASPALKQLLKDAATAATLRDQSVGDGAQSGDEEISVTYNRRVKSAAGKAVTIMAQVAPDGQLVLFSVRPAGKARSKPLKYQTDKTADGRRQPVEITRGYVDAFLAGDMQPLLDHASPALKQLMKDPAAMAELRQQSVGNGAKSADEEIAITYHRRVKSAAGQAFAIVAELAPDGQLVAFSVEPAGEAPSKPLKDQADLKDHPEKSPFAAVRWHESQPEVKVGDEWFQLVSLDGLPAAEIVAFSQRTYRDRWQMRFEEDLVALLTRMGHPPQDKVTLVVQALNSAQTQTLADIAMTKANRDAIRDATRGRKHGEPEQPTRPDVSNDAPGEAPSKVEKAVNVPAEALEKLVGSYELAPGLPVTVEASGGKLMIGLMGQPAQQVFARSETVWFCQGVDATFTFNVGKNGKCDSLVLTQKQTAKRKE